MKCESCEAPDRKIWPPSSATPEFEEVASGNWLSLDRCGICGILWFGVPYEPYASFTYYVAWPNTVEEWEESNTEDEGMSLQEWHTKQLRAHKKTLTEKDKEAIRWHNERSYGRGPYEKV